MHFGIEIVNIFSEVKLKNNSIMKIRIKNPIWGVPITFLYKYNPTQFEIIGMSASAGYNKDIVGIPFIGEKDARCLINGKNVYARILIRKIRK